MADRVILRVEIHLLPEEYSQLLVDAISANLHPGELLRRRYFDEPPPRPGWTAAG